MTITGKFFLLPCKVLSSSMESFINNVVINIPKVKSVGFARGIFKVGTTWDNSLMKHLPNTSSQTFFNTTMTESDKSLVLQSSNYTEYGVDELLILSNETELFSWTTPLTATNMSQHQMNNESLRRSSSRKTNQELDEADGKDYNRFHEQVWPNVFFPLLFLTPVFIAWCVARKKSPEKWWNVPEFTSIIVIGEGIALFIFFISILSGVYHDQCVAGNGALTVHIDAIRLVSQATDSSWFDSSDEVQIFMGSGVTPDAPMCKYAPENREDFYSMSEGQRHVVEHVKMNSFYDWPIYIKLVELDSGLLGADDESEMYKISSKQLAHIRYAIHQGYIKKYKLSRVLTVKGGNIFSENKVLGLIAPLLCVSVFDVFPGIGQTVTRAIDSTRVGRAYHAVYRRLGKVDKGLAYSMIGMEMITQGCSEDCLYNALHGKKRGTTLELLKPYATQANGFRKLYDHYYSAMEVAAQVSDYLEICLNEFVGEASDARYKVPTYHSFFFLELLYFFY